MDILVDYHCDVFIRIRKPDAVIMLESPHGLEGNKNLMSEPPKTFPRLIAIEFKAHVHAIPRKVGNRTAKH